MPKFDTINALNGISSSELQKIAIALNATGFVTDEDSLAFGSEIIEHWTHKCDQFLINEGYSGQKLESTGKYFPHCGAIYVLYDTGQHNRDDAIQQLNNAAKKHPLP